MPIPVIRGRIPETHEKEFVELQHYASGAADAGANEIGRGAAEPWEEVIRRFEPAMVPAVARMIGDAELAPLIKGSVIDVGAGTCYLTAKLSQLPSVDRAYALDLSEQFLSTTGQRVLEYFGADTSKVSFIASDFNDIPLPDASVDAAFIFAAIHHSLSPIKTLQEVGRILKPGGVIFVLENPTAVIRIRAGRKRSLSLSTHVTEIAYTFGELEYLIANANVGPCVARRWDVLSRPGPRRWLRTIVRAVGLENVLLNPPNYLFVIRKQRDPLSTGVPQAGSDLSRN